MKIPPSLIESFQLLRVPFTIYKEKQQPQNVPDIDLVEQDEFYLIRQRVENLREKIGKTVDEILELKNLESKYSDNFSSLEAIPHNLGVPSRIDKFISALEAKRLNRNNTEYDGNLNDDCTNSINFYYINLLQTSWLNKKSVRFLDKDRKFIHSRGKEISIFDVFDKENISKAFGRCTDIVTSPIYDKMVGIDEEYYNLQCGAQIRLKDKSVKFLVPMKGFADIPKFLQAYYIEFSCILPKYAHAKKRYFRKGAALNDFFEYIEKLDIHFSNTQREFLYKLFHDKKLRLYCEKLEEKTVRGFFLSIRGFSQEQHYIFFEKLLHFINRSDVICANRVLPHKNFPEWMKRIGGIIIERKDGKFANLLASE